MAVTSAVADLIRSFTELLSSAFGAAYAVVHSFLAGLIGLFTGFFAFVGDLVKGAFDLVGGVGRFVAGKYWYIFRTCTPVRLLQDTTTGNSSWIVAIGARNPGRETDISPGSKGGSN